MDNKEFKYLFNTLAQAIGFEAIFGGWFKCSSECILILELQKSNFSNSYYLNIKIFIQGAFSRQHSKNKDLVKKVSSDIFRRQPREYEAIFDLDVPMQDFDRKEKLEKFFNEFIALFAEKAITKEGIKELEQQGYIYIYPPVKKELDQLNLKA